MGDWKDYWKKDFRVSDNVHEMIQKQILDQISLQLTARDNAIINEIEQFNGGPFKDEAEAVIFYQTRCSLSIFYGDTIDAYTLCIDGDPVKIWYEKTEINVKENSVEMSVKTTEK